MRFGIVIMMLGAMFVAGWIGVKPAIFETKPIMTCDPTTLVKGETVDEVLVKCGQPERKTAEKDWYPLLGDKNIRGNVILNYGDVTSKDRNVNLYFDNDKLRSVQIYGDWK